MRIKFYATFIAIIFLFIFSPFQLFAQIKESAAKQIQSLILEKESRTPAQKKMDSHLLYAAKQDRNQPLTPLINSLELDIKKGADGLVMVDIQAEVTTNLINAINTGGGKIYNQSVAYKSIRAGLPLQLIEQIASLTDVRFIYRADEARHANNNSAKNDKIGKYLEAGYKGVPYRNDLADSKKFRPDFNQRMESIKRQVKNALESEYFKKEYKAYIGSVTSQGDLTHRAAEARSFFGTDGTGVKIGILSDGVGGLALAQASGDLGTVTILPGQAGSGAEGTAMLEIVHDLAPGAELFFASAFTSQASFAQNILDLRAAGCDIICDDVFYFREAAFQDDNVAASVNIVTASGALYFSSAGNQGNKNDNTSSAWEGDFVDGGASAIPLPLTGNVHNFSGGTTFNTLTGAARVVLYWSDPLAGSGNDYDIYILNSTGTSVVASSTNVQSGTQDPVEDAGNRTTGQQVVIFRKTGAATRALHLNGFGGGTGPALTFNTQGQTHGHSGAANAFCVAATPVSAPFCGSAPSGPSPNPFTVANKVECFSSDGPRRIFYTSAGIPITAGNVLFATSGGEVRQKPDITAADGNVVTGVGGFGSPFYGTSSAAPHAAAIAGLIKSKLPLLTPAQIRTALVSSALDIETAGIDRDAGAGIVMAFQSLQAAGATGVPVINTSGATLVSESCSPANGVIDPGETVTVSFCIQNVGGANTTSLVGTLQTSGGITSPGAPQNYGVVTSGGPSVCRNFTFTNSGTCGGSITASIQFQDGATNLGTKTYSFNLGVAGAPVLTTFSNTGAIIIPGTGTGAAGGAPASPYPSNIAVSGISNPVSKVTVQITGFSHTFPDDIALLLVSPAGKKIILMSGSGAGNDVVNENIIFDDAAATTLPTTIPSNGTATFKPTDGDPSYTLPAPAPARTYSVLLSDLNGQNANGTWSLYGADFFNTDAGSISGGWILNITTQAYTCCTNVSAAPTVTINQAVGQTDPTSASPINFTAVFSEAVTGFDGADILFTGSTVGGTLTAVVTGAGPTYNVAVSGMTGNGTVVASIPANAAINAGSTGNTASTSTDNSVSFGTPPNVTINQGATQVDPATSAPVVFDVLFSQPVTGFTASDISFTGSTAPGTLSAVISGSSATYTVSVSGMTGSGLVIASIPANSAINSIGFGNLASTSTDNSVQFNPPPCTITCPANITVNTNANQCGAVVTLPAPTTVGTCGTVTYSPLSGSFFPKGTTIVTATSSTGPTCSFTVTVVDAQAPSITCPATVTVGCASAVPVVSIASVTATDNCPGVVVTYVSDVISAQTCANRYTITRTYRATDAVGLTSTCSQTIIVNDVTGPVIAAIADITTPTGVGSCTATVTFAPTATDGCGGTVTITSVPASGTAFSIGTTPVTITATDVCGNASTRTFNVIVTDAQPATITVQPNNQTVCAGSNATFSVTATGAVSYKWQQFIGGVWTDIAGATGPSITVNSVTLNMNTNTFRVIVNGLCSSVTSTQRTLFVNPLPSITLSTTSASILPGQITSIVATVNPTGGTFVWFRNGVVVSGVTGASIGNITVDNAGTYRAVYTDLNGCVSTSADLVISAQASDRLFIAPNPNFGQFSVRFFNQQSEQLTVQVFNSNGGKVYQKVVTTTLAYTKIDVDLRLNAPGVYIVQLRNSAGKLLASKNMIVSHR